jgi:hypothetical protein
LEKPAQEETQARYSSLILQLFIDTNPYLLVPG